MTQYKEDLDHYVCTNPACTEVHALIYLHGSCHPAAKLRVGYDKQKGVLKLECGTCRKVVGVIAVAAEPTYFSA